ncbi:MAG: acyl-CoA thioesterase/BAAT N-terminal domain-containing protein [Eubacteriaceae bacterium]|nr:acyl-CoA thioesterase/BAAT N-terminal domain-containing protein [Eubacteriaceae bacterium]
MQIYISEKASMADRKIEIMALGLLPGENVKFTASMSYPWAPSVVFKSTANFIADDSCCVDLSRQAPVSGDYQNADAMGLITSMRHVSGELKDAWENISIGKSMQIEISAECGAQSATATIERSFLAQETKVEMIADPFVGAFFYSDAPHSKTVLMLGGSSGELINILPVASLLAAHGFNVLAVAYFAEPRLPKELMRIPLEYFGPVFSWLDANPFSKGKDIYMHCMSKGGELGLLLAAIHPEIKKIAAYAPHAYCFQGTSFTKHASSWTYKGEELAYIRLQFRTLYADMLRCIIKNEPFGYTHTHVMGLKRARNKEQARIKVEEIKADLLIFSGKQCNMWNSHDGCTEIMAQLGKCNYKYSYEYIAYENAGEPFYAPYIIPESIRLSMKIAPRLALTMGGTIQGNTDAVIDSWERMLAFFS